MIKTITLNHVQYFLSQNGVNFPYNHDIKINDLWECNESDWNAYQWNPPEGYDDPDPNASLKPTWEEMVIGQRKYNLTGLPITDSYTIQSLSTHRTDPNRRSHNRA